MDLTEDDVLEILNLIEKSNFDFLQLEMGDLKLVVSKSGSEGARVRWGLTETPAASAPAPKAPEPKKELPVQPQPKVSVARDGTVPITAPMVGTFYITPEPGAPPFVEVGSHVDEDTTVGLIEVMKVFNAVKSSVRGTIVESCVQGGQFVEHGQTLFLVKPDGKG